MKETYYSILGVEPSATDKQIKRAYYRLARDLHPDKAPNPKARAENEQRFAAVSKAYNILKDKKKRAKYDQTLDKVSSKPEAEGPQQDMEESSVSREVRSIAPERKKEKILIARKAHVKGIQIFRKQDYDKSITFFRAAIENDNQEATYFYHLALAMLRAKKSFTKAVDYANKAIEMDPYNMDYKLLLGQIYEMAGVITKAKKIYEEILKWDPTHEKANQRMELLGFSQKRGSKSFFVNLIKRISGK